MAASGARSEPRRRLAVRAAVAAAVVLALALIVAGPLGWRLDAPAYDLLSTIAPPAPADDIVVVAIDEPSFAEIGRQWPWPRALHGQLVTALRAAGARVVGLDIVFAEASSAEGDQALADALGPDVVLGADLTVIETPHATQTIRVDPLPAFLARGATPGLVAVTLDRDGVLRRVRSAEDAFAGAVAAASGAASGASPKRALIRFRGGPRTYRTISYYQALDPGTFLPPGALRDAVVVVGLSTQTAADASAGGTDAFATPYTSRTGRLTSGVEIQATLVDALRSRDLVTPAPLWAELLALAVAGAAGLGLAGSGRVSWRSVAGAAALVAGVIAACWLALQHAGFWLPPAAPSLAVLLVVGAEAALDYGHERRTRREIARAFEQYLAPEVVKRLVRDPSALKLGGERRTLSILFCDIRGFTELAERMKGDPERLTLLINRLLGPLSDAVLAEGGTIDKYIGDCVMAFWNAPLDAPDHAERAIAAGLRMLDAVERLNAELNAEAGPGVAPLEFAVGVGINTGDCVVGNLGSDRRFDYTAVGDAVNLASRLEGASKLYGVRMLVADDTATRFSTPLIELDRIAVKGRRDGALIHTALPGADVSDAQAAFLGAYRARRWDDAEQALAAVRAAEPRLALYAGVMAARIAGYRAAPPPDDWNGVFAATVK
ncbi:adenylate/guanylate cyclase domain-containing protein [Methylopila sp. 73B]|uniref:CHASE2 domain-containing protein n=1 Tax=Methylopila sp. 73B TaxID=1120792 RepID=UPI0003748B58|nr:adenylate/guanylate cyclase domain-containing protein [Methylopila sp. 73B]